MILVGGILKGKELNYAIHLQVELKFLTRRSVACSGTLKPVTANVTLPVQPSLGLEPYVERLHCVACVPSLDWT